MDEFSVREFRDKISSKLVEERYPNQWVMLCTVLRLIGFALLYIGDSIQVQKKEKEA